MISDLPGCWSACCHPGTGCIRPRLPAAYYRPSSASAMSPGG